MTEWWRDDAACLQVHPDTMFPDEKDRWGAAAAKRVCASCPARARAECLRYAVDENIQHGIFGGMTPLQRARLRNRTADA